MASGTLLESVSAHGGAVWSVCVAPDRRGFVTGSADHSVKFWEFELVSEEKEVKTRCVSEAVYAAKSCCNPFSLLL